MRKDSFEFQLKWCSTLMKCPAEIRLEVFDAIMSYALNGTHNALTPMAQFVFSSIQDEIDKNRKAYEAIVEKRRNAINLRWQREKAGATDTNEYKCIHMNTSEYTCMNQEENNKEKNLPNNPVNQQFNTFKSIDSTDTSIQMNTNVYKCTNQEKEKKQEKEKFPPNNPLIKEKEINKEKEDDIFFDDNNILLTNNIIKEKKTKTKTKKVFTEFEQQFEDFRKHYPGIKRGFQKEFDNFKKKHPDWQDLLPLLIPAVDRLIAYTEQRCARGEWVAEYPHLQTWLNQSRWEVEFPDITEQPNNKQHSNNGYYKSSAEIEYERRQAEFRDYISRKLATPYEEPDISEYY